MFLGQLQRVDQRGFAGEGRGALARPNWAGPIWIGLRATQSVLQRVSAWTVVI